MFRVILQNIQRFNHLDNSKSKFLVITITFNHKSDILTPGAKIGLRFKTLGRQYQIQTRR